MPSLGVKGETPTWKIDGRNLKNWEILLSTLVIDVNNSFA